MTLDRVLMFSLALALLAPGCGDDDDGGEGDDSSTTDDSATTDDSSEPEIEVSGVVRGTVTVLLYDDSSGDIESVEYADVGYSDFPFGRVFVGAYTDQEDADGQTRRRYHGDTAIASPTIGGDTYEMQVEVTGTDQVYVYAQVDWVQDRVLGTGDPVGHHPTLVTIPDGDTIEGVDITILAPVYCSERAVPNCGGGCDTTTISGEVIITVSYAGGDVATFLQGTDGSGPHHVTWSTPSADGGGASAPYTLTTCTSRGEQRLRGAWDSNGNELIDPRDRWGAWSTGNDADGDPVDANPVTVGATALSGYDVVIPLGDEEPFAVVPFTALSGEVTVEAGGPFEDTLPSGTDVYIAALRYRPNLDLSVAELTREAYSHEVWTWAELQGTEAQSFILPVPADTIVYLWAYGDTDGDGIINESGEFVGVPEGASTGRIPTGGEGYSGLEVRLAQP